MNKIIVFDLETTGFANACGIHQIAMLLVVDNQIFERIVHDVNPGKVRMDKEALTLANKTKEDIAAHPSIFDIKSDIDELLKKHIDISNPQDRWKLCGYNNHRFDNRFWDNLYLEHDELTHGEFVGTFTDIYFLQSIDVSKNVREYFRDRDDKPKNFSLSTIAKYFEIEVDESKLHTALYDAELTYLVHNKLIELNNEVNAEEKTNEF